MEIEIFTDETFIVDKKTNTEYLGIGCLFVPTSFKKEFVDKLLELRCMNENSDTWHWDFKNCLNSKAKLCKEKWHKLNNKEIHYKELREKSPHHLKEISKRWIKFLLQHNQNYSDKNKLIYFKILYIDLKKLDKTFFGNEETDNIVYNRFYRMVILGAKNFFFKDEKFIIKEFFHDKSSEKELSNIFPWNTPNKLDKIEDVDIQKDTITFIDSNHNNYAYEKFKKNAQFIQFIDLILGCINQILFQPAKAKIKNEISNIYYPLFKKIWEEPNNKNSHLNFYRKQDVSIFPKEKMYYQ